MKYQKLDIPAKSAWDKKTWKYYTPVWFNRFIESLQNLIDWLPVIWKDRHWDDYYITKILQRKIELQRKYIVNANRHTSVPTDNYWMTVVLNLLKREHESFYETEQYDFIDSDLFINDGKLVEKLRNKNTNEALEKYLKKYPSTIRKVKAKFPNISFDNKKYLAMYVGLFNQKKCRDLIFEILKQKSIRWWD